MVLSMVIVFSISACGGSSEGNQASSESQVQVAEETPFVDDIPTPDVETVNPITVDTFIGEWQEGEAQDRLVTISKTDSGFEYKDNEGAYPATFAEGVLKLNVAENDYAKVFIDSKSGKIYLSYQDSLTELIKKNK